MGWYKDGNWDGLEMAEDMPHILSALCIAVNEREELTENTWGINGSPAAMPTKWTIKDGAQKSSPNPIDFDIWVNDLEGGIYAFGSNITKLRKAIESLGAQWRWGDINNWTADAPLGNTKWVSGVDPYDDLSLSDLIGLGGFGTSWVDATHSTNLNIYLQIKNVLDGLTHVRWQPYWTLFVSNAMREITNVNNPPGAEVNWDNTKIEPYEDSTHYFWSDPDVTVTPPEKKWGAGGVFSKVRGPYWRCFSMADFSPVGGAIALDSDSIHDKQIFFQAKGHLIKGTLKKGTLAYTQYAVRSGDSYFASSPRTYSPPSIDIEFENVTQGHTVTTFSTEHFYKIISFDMGTSWPDASVPTGSWLKINTTPTDDVPFDYINLPQDVHLDALVGFCPYGPFIGEGGRSNQSPNLRVGNSMSNAVTDVAALLTDQAA